jgi:hypothetical protein
MEFSLNFAPGGCVQKGYENDTVGTGGRDLLVRGGIGTKLCSGVDTAERGAGSV